MNIYIFSFHFSRPTRKSFHTEVSTQVDQSLLQEVPIKRRRKNKKIFELMHNLWFDWIPAIRLTMFKVTKIVSKTHLRYHYRRRRQTHYHYHHKYLHHQMILRSICNLSIITRMNQNIFGRNRVDVVVRIVINSLNFIMPLF